MADPTRFTVGPEAQGTRLDAWLAARPGVGSRSKAKAALASGKVTIDGAVVGSPAAGQPVTVGSEVAIHWNQPGTSRRRTRARETLGRLGISVLHVDERRIVVDKPPGLLTDAADAEQRRHRDTLRKRVAAYCGHGVWPVHRIDRDTSGVVAFAKDESTFEAMRRLWTDPRTLPDRIYVAVVAGEVTGESGQWADWMAWDAPHRLQRAANADAPGAVQGIADWRVVQRLRGATLIEVALVTGKRNQIRLSAMLHGHPLLGETLYRPDVGAPPLRLRFARQALHAKRLKVADLTIEAPLPEDLRVLVRRLTIQEGSPRPRRRS